MPSLPSWIFDLKALLPLAALGGAGIRFLVDLAKNPLDVIWDVIIRRLLLTIVGYVLDATTFLIRIINLAFEPLHGVPAALTSPILSGGSTVLSALLSMINTLNVALVGLTTSLGPVSPIAVAAMWAVIAFGAAWLVRRTLEANPWT